MVIHKTVTLSGSAQKLSELIPNSVAIPGIRQLFLQPDAANTGDVYVGGPGVTASDYGVALGIPAASVTPPPFAFGHLDHPKFVTLADVYVIGTADEKVHVMFVPYI